MGISLALTGLVAIVFLIMLLHQGASRTHWLHAAGQILFIWVLSNIPLGFLLIDSSLDPSSKSIFDSIRQQVRMGEAVVYLAAILAPVLFTLLMNYSVSAKVYVMTNIVGVILCVGCASYIYALHIRQAPADTDTLFIITGTLYALCVLIWYFSVVYELIVTNPDPGKSSKDRATEIEDSLP